MLERLTRLFRPERTRALDAGSGGRRLGNARTIVSLNADILSTATTIQRRASYMARNNSHITAAVNALVTNIVGPGIKPSSQHPDRAIREALHAAWSTWVDQADFDGSGDFYALQAMSVRQMVEAGESFSRFRHDPDTGAFQIQMLHPEQVPIDSGLGLVTNRVRAGIEFDADGRRVAFHVLPFRPSDPLAPLTDFWATIPVPVTEAVHLFNPVEPGQLRGLSWLAPVLLAVHELDQLQDAALMRAKLANLICAALVDAQGNAGGMPGTATNGTLDVDLEPGTILPLPPGTTLEFFDPKESQHYGEFIKSHLQSIAAGLGIPYELLTGDLSSVNYSSIRAGLVEFRKRLEHWQHNVVIFRLCRPVWNRFIRTLVLTGQIDWRVYQADPSAFHRVEWLPPKPQWVDPLKDTQAEEAAVAAGFKSRTQVITSMGYDPEQVDAERAADAERAGRLKLTVPAPIAAPKDAANV